MGMRWTAKDLEERDALTRAALAGRDKGQPDGVDFAMASGGDDGVRGAVADAIARSQASATPQEVAPQELSTMQDVAAVVAVPTSPGTVTIRRRFLPAKAPSKAREVQEDPLEAGGV